MPLQALRTRRKRLYIRMACVRPHWIVAAALSMRDTVSIKRTAIGLIVLWLSACTNVVAAADTHIFEALSFGRESLQRGVFRCQGQWVETKGGISRNGDIEMLCAFDALANNWRFDRKQAYSTRVGEKRAQPIHTKLAWTAKDAKIWEVGRPLAEVYSADFRPKIYGKPFDVRTIGLMYWADFLNGTSLESVLDAYRATAPDEVKDEDGSVTRATWIRRKSLHDKRTVWLDKTKEYAPIRLEVSYPKTPVGEKEEWQAARVVSDATWKKVSGVWVPETYRIEYRPPSGNMSRYDLAFEWETVNDSVPNSWFEFSSFELPTGTVIADSRLGTPIIIEKIGYPGIYEKFYQRSQWGVLRFLGLGLTLALLVGTVMVLWHKYRSAVS
jgi:hypothetical protein